MCWYCHWQGDLHADTTGLLTFHLKLLKSKNSLIRFNWEKASGTMMQRVADLPPLTVHDHLNLLERGSGWMVDRVTEGDMLLFIKAFTSNTHHPLFTCWQACLTLTGWGAVIAAMCVLTLDVVLNKWACLFCGLSEQQHARDLCWFGLSNISCCLQWLHLLGWIVYFWVISHCPGLYSRFHPSFSVPSRLFECSLLASFQSVLLLQHLSVSAVLSRWVI